MFLQFLAQLQELFDLTATKGSVYLTQKRCMHAFCKKPSDSSPNDDYHAGLCAGTDTYSEPPASDAPDASLEASTSEARREYPCIIRATCGGTSPSKKKIKISTLVQPGDYTSFTSAYGTLMKTHMAKTMIKKDKKKQLKKKELRMKEVQARQKKAGAAGKALVSRTGLPKVTGPRRGAGHGKRQALMKRRYAIAKRILAQRYKDRQRKGPARSA